MEKGKKIKNLLVVLLLVSILFYLAAPKALASEVEEKKEEISDRLDISFNENVNITQEEIKEADGAENAEEDDLNRERELTREEKEQVYYLQDTDGDGLSDYFEYLILEGKILTIDGKQFKTDPLLADTDGDGLLDGEEIKIVQSAEDGRLYAEVHSLPDALDSDYDGIPDGTKDYDGATVEADSDPMNNEFWGHTEASDYKFDLKFKVDYRHFFEPEGNTRYRKDLSVLGSIYATLAYQNFLELTGKETFSGNIETTFSKFGLKNVENYKLADYFEDDDISQMIIGHRKVSYNHLEKEIIIVSVRGTDGTIEEWSSNFDVGADIEEYWDRENPDWKNKKNHKGFDVAANRLYAEIEAYVQRHDLSAPKAIFIVGHSRGAAIANILGAKLEESDVFEPYTYTFATPNTTVDKGNYKTIFNLVNSDDLVPYLPIEKWGFDRYGTTYSISIKDHYESACICAGDGTWDFVFGQDYNSNGNLQKTLEEFSAVTETREDVYKFTQNLSTVYIYKDRYSTLEEAEQAKDRKRERYGERIARFAELGVTKMNSVFTGKPNYCVYVRQTPAAFMMILSDVIAKKQHYKENGVDRKIQYVMRGIGEDKFLKLSANIGFFVAPQYAKAKAEFIWSGADSAKIALKLGIGGMMHTHMPGTYCFLAQDSKRLLPQE